MGRMRLSQLFSFVFGGGRRSRQVRKQTRLCKVEQAGTDTGTGTGTPIPGLSSLSPTKIKIITNHAIAKPQLHNRSQKRERTSFSCTYILYSHPQSSSRGHVCMSSILIAASVSGTVSGLLGEKSLERMYLQYPYIRGGGGLTGKTLCMSVSQPQPAILSTPPQPPPELS